MITAVELLTAPMSKSELNGNEITTILKEVKTAGLLIL
jgi:hypothetical protein